MPEETGQQQQQGAPDGQQQPGQQQQTPPWGDAANFDPEKAWNLIQGLRADKEKLATRPVLDETAQRKLAEYDRLEQASKTDLERKTEEVSRWQSDAEKWRAAAVASTVKALAGADFADPDDAVRNLDTGKYLDAGGIIDEQAIRRDLDTLLTSKPHYRRPDGQQQHPTARVPAPNRSQGAGGNPALSPADEFAAIIEGRLKA